VPTIITKGPYRLFFYASDRNEPHHVHVERDDMIAKFWLYPVRISSSFGFSRIELTKIHKMIEENEGLLMEAWNEYFEC